VETRTRAGETDNKVLIFWKADTVAFRLRLALLSVLSDEISEPLRSGLVGNDNATIYGCRARLPKFPKAWAQANFGSLSNRPQFFSPDCSVKPGVRYERGLAMKSRTAVSD
jgi:hypothetical protein